MKKTVVCNIPMKNNVEAVVYTSDDISVPASDRKVRYAINAFLEKTMSAQDEINFILLTQNDDYSCAEVNTKLFIDEISEINKNIGATLSFKKISADFSQKPSIHEQLLADIVDELAVNDHVLADITYGSKNIPIVLFCAFEFAEKFLNCEIENIIYGQASFDEQKPVNTKICDMIPLYYLNSVNSAIRCDDPKKAKQMLKVLLSL